MSFTATSWTAQDIIKKVRNITGTPVSATNQSALSDDDIANYINTYYTFVMPYELKEQVNFQPFNFQALPNIDEYTFQGLTQTGQPMAYADGFPLIFYQDRDIFFQDWPQQYGSDNIATGDGVTTLFAGTTQAFPIIQGGPSGTPGIFILTDGSQVIFDKSNGILYQTVLGFDTIVGTLNYISGAFSATFNTAPASTATIYNKYQAYQPARPQGVLLDSTDITTSDTLTLTFRPVPDQLYAITLQGYIVQTQLSTTGSTPLQTEWGQLIAYGAALEIYSDRGDLVAYNQTFPIFKRYENVALGRFVQQLDNVQSVPRF